MSLRPLAMEHFVLAIPRPFEDEVMESLARLGIVQPTKEKVEIGEEVKEIVAYDEFLRLGDRVTTILSSLADVLKIKKGYVAPKVNLRMDLNEIETFTRERGKEVDRMAREIEDLERENGELQVMGNNLEFLVASRIKLNQLRKLEHVFVKAGFVQNAFITSFLNT